LDNNYFELVYIPTDLHHCISVALKGYIIPTDKRRMVVFSFYAIIFKLQIKLQVIRQ